MTRSTRGLNCTKATLVAVGAALSLTIVSAQAPAPGQGRGTGRGIQAPAYPVLPLGSDLPHFSLPGVDGKNHSPAELRSAKILAVMFESNHCPASLAYQERVHELLATYKTRGFGLMLINPNNPRAVRLNELGYTDMNDSFDEMKVRARFYNWTLPYLYDGETQTTGMKFGAVATPHIFIFDAERKLRYQGAIDDSRNSAGVKLRYAADAIEALLAGRQVATPETRALGCTTKWIDRSIAGVEDEMKAIQATPVSLTPIDAAGLKALRANATSNKTTIVSFWRTGDRLSEAQFADLQTSFRMYSLSPRPVDMVTVSLDAPDQSAKVLAYLKSQYATSTNRQFATTDVAPLQAAFGLKWNPSQAFTVIIDPAGNITYQKQGRIDIREVRRVVLTTVPDNPSWPGIQDYYKKVVARMAGR
jgi:hypothetical protein